MIRQRVVAGALALFVALWLLIALILVSGHDPALGRQRTLTARARTHTTSAATTEPTSVQTTPKTAAATSTRTATHTATTTSTATASSSRNAGSGVSPVTSSQS
ncbi:MAG: hypothetical protein M3016_07550 [Actinomycetota bacterium]|nr:hypothetical protein [Actinomycetota bacterium]